MEMEERKTIDRKDFEVIDGQYSLYHKCASEGRFCISNLHQDISYLIWLFIVHLLITASTVHTNNYSHMDIT